MEIIPDIEEKERDMPVEVHPSAVVGPDVLLGEGSVIGPFVVISGQVELGIGTIIESHCSISGDRENPTTIGPGSTVRSHSCIYPGVVVGPGFESGHHVTIRSGSLIGSNVSIGTMSDIQGNCEIGDFTHLHSNVHVCQGSKIGKFCWLFPGVIMTNDPRPPSSISTGPTVEDEVVLTVNVTLMPGVLVRKGTVALPGAVIAGDTTEDSLHFGPRGSQLDSVKHIRMPSSGTQAYPWIVRFGEGEYPSQNLESQRNKRH